MKWRPLFVIGPEELYLYSTTKWKYNDRAIADVFERETSQILK